MDNLTHSLVGVALSRVYFKQRMVYATTAAVIAANLADLDVLYSWPGIRYLEFHRGVLHSVWMVPVWGIAVALGLRWFAAKRKKTSPPLWMGFALGALAALSHVLLDWCNAYGTRLWAPFSERWYALDWLPVLDPWVWLILLAVLGVPLLLGLITTEVGTPRRSAHRTSGAVALILLAGWIGLRARQHSDALDLLNLPSFAPYMNGQLPYDWAALPTASPFNWQAVVDLPSNYLIADIWAPLSSDEGAVALRRNYIKPPSTPAIQRAEQTKTGGIFLWYARFPMADEEQQGENFRVLLTDMRYAQGVMRPAMHATIGVGADLRILGESFSWSR